MRITPVLVVESVEECLPFWIDRMGFEKTAEVPDGDRVGFAILNGSGAELMLQSIESVRKDVPEFAPKSVSNTATVFIEVDDFADTVKRLDGYPVTLAERTTFYGMREIGVFEPGGNIIIFAARS